MGLSNYGMKIAENKRKEISHENIGRTFRDL
jgi:hypothetical protein